MLTMEVRFALWYRMPYLFMEKEQIVIIGFGWVGQANALALIIDGYEVHFFDPGNPPKHYSEYQELYPKIKKLSSPLEIDSPKTSYIVCVGDRVDMEGNQDISSIEKALESLNNVKGTVLLRSTILPSSLKNLNFDIYLPEFLHEKAAVKECVNPQYVVVGKYKDMSEPSFLEIWRRRSIKMIDVSPEDASHIKYLSNLWNALRIAFTNEYGCSVAEPVDNQTVAHIDKVLNFVFENGPYLRYGKSFSGHCLPKDARAYVKWDKDRGRHIPLLAGMLESNDAHRAREEKYNHLPQWYSNWPEPAGSGWVALNILGRSIKRNIFHPISAWKRRKSVIKRKAIK